MRHFLPRFALLAACTFPLAAQAVPGEASEPTGMERMQHWAADHAALLDAKLAGLRAGLELTSDQDKLWPPFETAVRDAAKLHMEQMKSMMDRMQKMRDMMWSMQKSEDMKDMRAAGQESRSIDWRPWGRACPRAAPLLPRSLTPLNPYMEASTTPRRGDSCCLAGCCS